MRRCTSFLIVLFLAAQTRPASAAWQTFGRGDGLVGNSIVAMARDSTESLWFGTPDGASHYDGVNWRNFTTANGLPDNSVHAIMVDHAGVAWLSTDAGLSRYDGSTWKTYSAANGLPSNLAGSIVEDHQGNIWVAWNPLGPGAGVSRFDGTTWRAFTSELASNSVASMFVDRAGAIWFGTETGPTRYDGTNWTRFAVPNASRATTITQDRSGAMWFAGDFMVTRYDGTNWAYFQRELPAGEVTNIYEDRVGNLWVSTWGGGLARYDGSSWKAFGKGDGIANLFITRILEDGSGAFWYATDGGVARFDGEAFEVFKPYTTLPDPSVRTVAQDHLGNFWFGSSGGLTRYDGTSWQTFSTLNSPLPSNFVTHVREDHAGSLWLCTGQGVTRYDGSTWTTYDTSSGLANNNVWQSLEDRAGNIWFATSNGLSRWDRQTWRRYDVSQGLGHNFCEALAEDHDGAIWVGTVGGVTRLTDNSFRLFTTSDGLPDNHIDAILVDRSGAVWITTDAGGVSRYQDGHWQNYSRNDGLASNLVFSIAQDSSGALWFGTSGGATRFDGTTWKSYTHLDGLVADNVSGIMQARSGDLWFTSWAGGVTRYSPDHIPPQTVITQSPQPISSARSQTNRFEAGFKEPSGAAYSYALNGGPWTPWGSDNFWLGQDLADGNYTFQVRSRDLSGNVDPSPALSRFEIDATSPTASIVAPSSNQALQDSVTIRGTAADERFAFYRLEFRRQGILAWSSLVQSGSAEVRGGILGGWNTRELEDGIYELRLSVTDTLGLTGSFAIPVLVDNQFPYAAETSPALVTAAAGGNVFTGDLAAHLYIPPHGLARDTIVTVAEIDTNGVAPMLPDGATRVGSVYELGWGTVRLSKTATLDLLVPGPPGPGEDVPLVYARDADSAWRPIGGTFDPASARITLPVDSPGQYGLFRDGAAPPSAGGVALSGISLTPRVFSPHGGSGTGTIAIGFSLSRPGPVTVHVYNRAGRLVRDVAESQNLGGGVNVLKWDGRDNGGREVPEGPYLVSIRTLGETQTRVLAIAR
jgi:ligand-binding sensor domain-containing protein